MVFQFIPMNQLMHFPYEAGFFPEEIQIYCFRRCFDDWPSAGSFQEGSVVGKSSYLAGMAHIHRYSPSFLFFSGLHSLCWGITSCFLCPSACIIHRQLRFVNNICQI